MESDGHSKDQGPASDRLPDADAATTLRPAPGGGAPARIGPFRILAPIGEGAMGIVYEAEQERPQRRVALKIVRPGMVPADVLRRFELEYEFLGRLHHPGIAQIYQAGIEETGYGPQPYFAMELVRGRRLDEYVRTKRPGLRERLVLVAAIADAVQHAHHRGIIHRDLKPANILVTEAGEPKVLDFGIARAAAHDGVMTAHTFAGEVLGTLSYMSPEQVAGDASGLDTRSDVYALGVILYEVLAERPPYDLDRKSFAEAARIIHDEEPTRLRSVTRVVPADVETIVAKALEKEKERRYSSAAELADDIRRFLRDEPITARPPSAAYQVRKYARRHKAIVAGIVASLLALLVGVVATSWQSVRATRAERVAQARARDAETEKAKAEAVTRFLTETLAAVDPAQARGRDVSVREALDAAAAKIDGGAMAGQPEVEAAVRHAIGTTYASLGLLDAAEKQLLASLDLQQRNGATPLQRSDTHGQLVDLFYAKGKTEAAIEHGREALRLRRESLGEKRPEVATALDNLGAVLMSRGDMTEAEPLLRQALAIRRELLPADDPQLAVSLNNLGFLTWRKGSLQEAEAMYRESLDIDRRKLGPDHPEVPTKLLNIAIVYRDQGRPEEGEPLAREAVAIRRKVLGNQHPQLADAIDTLAGLLEDRGRNAEAETLLREALAIAQQAHGEVSRSTARIQHNLGWLLCKEGAYADAEPLLRTASINIPKTYGPAYRGGRMAMANLAHNLNGLGDYRAAETTARASIETYRNAPTDRMIVTALIALGQSLVGQRRQVEAVPLLREALTSVEQYPQARYPWFKGEAQSALGAAVAATGDAAEGERLMLAGYESMRDLPSTPPTRHRAAVGRLVSFYTATGRAAEAAPWRRRLQELGAAADRRKG